MDDLVQWLGQQYDEEGRAARAARDSEFCKDGHWMVRGPFEEGLGAVHSEAGEAILGEEESVPFAMAAHIAAHDPARVLREIGTKRQLLRAVNAGCPGCRAEHSFSGPCVLRWMGPAREEDGQRWVHNEQGARVEAPPVFPVWAVRLLALAYADRPGYREEWRP